MPSNLPFEPPDEHACIALYNEQKNAWWLVMTTYKDAEHSPWRKQIQATNGKLSQYLVVETYIGHSHSWKILHDAAREQIKNGFTVVDGGFNHIHPSGTRWLRAKPSLWWYMHSASVEQLQIVKESPQCCEFVWGAMARQGLFGIKNSCPGRRGPSVVVHRWNEVFPAEMAFARQCQSLGVGLSQALTWWESTENQSRMVVQSQELGPLLN